MKKSFIIIAPIIAICIYSFTNRNSATFTKHVTSSNTGVLLYWFVGTTYTGRQNTHANEILFSGCPDTGPFHCEDGYDDNDLFTPGDPYSGLASTATINDFITKY